MSVLPEKILAATDGSEQVARATLTAAELAGKLGADLHVSLERALMGSVSDSVVDHAHCPVLVVREEEE